MLNKANIGFVLKSYANYMESFEEDISHVSYFVSSKEYDDILKFHHSNGTSGQSRETILNYLNFVIFRWFSKKDKLPVVKNLVNVIVDRSNQSIFPPNKIDPHVAPISALSRNKLDLKLCSILSEIIIPEPQVEIIIPKYFPGKTLENYALYQDVYKRKSGERMWAAWYIKNGQRVPTKDALFDQFMISLTSCTKWTEKGIVSFLYNQCDMNPGMRKLLAELENKNDEMAFEMFCVLKEQKIQNITLDSLTKFYEESFLRLSSKKKKNEICHMGYKEHHAHTLTDVKIQMSSGFSISNHISHSINYFGASDEYENELVKYVSKNKIKTLPKAIHSSLYRKAALLSPNIESFFTEVFQTIKA